MFHCSQPLLLALAWCDAMPCHRPADSLIYHFLAGHRGQTHVSATGQTDATSAMRELVPIYNHASSESVLICVLAAAYLVRQSYHRMRDWCKKWQGGSSDINIIRTGRQSGRQSAAHYAVPDRIRP